jgi:hypothetical protein
MRICRVAESDHLLRHVRLSVRVEKLSSHRMDFRVIWHLNILRKPVDKNQFSLKSDKNNRYFT